MSKEKPNKKEKIIVFNDVDIINDDRIYKSKFKDGSDRTKQLLMEKIDDPITYDTIRRSNLDDVITFIQMEINDFDENIIKDIKDLFKLTNKSKRKPMEELKMRRLLWKYRNYTFKKLLTEIIGGKKHFKQFVTDFTDIIKEQDEDSEFKCKQKINSQFDTTIIQNQVETPGNNELDENVETAILNLTNTPAIHNFICGKATNGERRDLFRNDQSPLIKLLELYHDTDVIPEELNKIRQLKAKTLTPFNDYYVPLTNFNILLDNIDNFVRILNFEDKYTNCLKLNLLSNFKNSINIPIDNSKYNQFNILPTKEDYSEIASLAKNKNKEGGSKTEVTQEEKEKAKQEAKKNKEWIIKGGLGRWVAIFGLGIGSYIGSQAIAQKIQPDTQVFTNKMAIVDPNGIRIGSETLVINEKNTTILENYIKFTVVPQYLKLDPSEYADLKVNVEDGKILVSFVTTRTSKNISELFKTVEGNKKALKTKVKHFDNNQTYIEIVNTPIDQFSNSSNVAQGTRVFSTQTQKTEPNWILAGTKMIVNLSSIALPIGIVVFGGVNWNKIKEKEDKKEDDDNEDNNHDDE
jgi:hypothetical protein